MRIADGNFSSPEEKSAFLEKFDLAYYNKEMEEALALTGSDDAEQVELAYGEALKHAASIDRICFEYVPDEWNSVSDHHVIHEMITPIPNEYDRSMIVVKDARSGICDVILPGGAMAGGFKTCRTGNARCTAYIRRKSCLRMNAGRQRRH